MDLQNKEEEKKRKKKKTAILIWIQYDFEVFFFNVSLERLYVIVYVVTEEISFSCIF